MEHKFNWVRMSSMWGPVILNSRTRRPLIVDTKAEADDHCRRYKRAFRDRNYRVRNVTFREIEQ